MNNNLIKDKPINNNKKGKGVLARDDNGLKNDVEEDILKVINQGKIMRKRIRKCQMKGRTIKYY